VATASAGAILKIENVLAGLADEELQDLTPLHQNESFRG
jgi:hypothetical protein